MPTTLYFELEHYDRYHRADWEERLDAWLRANGPEVLRTSHADDAEFIIEPAQSHSLIGGRAFTVAPNSHYRRRPEATFAWDQGDHPNGRLPGLFCSLSRRLSDPARHRAFCYPLRMNRLVRECPQAGAEYLFGFSGNVTAPVRARIFSELKGAAQSGQALLRQTESLFMRIYSPETDVERARYLDDLQQTRFVLCPRGNGLSSIRLFEVMEAGRVPVIISDALQLPQCVDWASCAVVVSEREIPQIPALLEARDADWPLMARNARSEWERCFGNATLLPTLVKQLRDILTHRIRPERCQRYYFPCHVLPDYALVRAKSLVRHVQSVRRRLR